EDRRAGRQARRSAADPRHWQERRRHRLAQEFLAARRGVNVAANFRPQSAAWEPQKSTGEGRKCANFFFGRARGRRRKTYRRQRSVGPIMNPAISCSTGVHSTLTPEDG